MNSHDARPSGCTPFEEELMNAMNRFADSADAPDFDAPAIVRRTRRRRAVGIAAVATAFLVAGGGTALATMSDGGNHRERPSASDTVARSNAATLLYEFSDGQTVALDFSGWNLTMVKQQLAKTRTELGTVSERPVTGCKPGSVLAVSPHAPKTVKAGDTVNVVLCAK